MNKRILGMLMVVFLLLIGTNDALAQQKEIKKTAEPAQAEKEMFKSQAEVWKKTLDLSDEQTELLAKELEAYHSSMTKAKKGSKTNAAEILSEFEEKFDAILTEEQRKKYSELRVYKKTSKEKMKSK